MIALLQIIYDKITDRSRGFAFVTMATAEEAAKAVQMFNGAVSSALVGSSILLHSTQKCVPVLGPECICVNAAAGRQDSQGEFPRSAARRREGSGIGSGCKD